MFALSGVQHVWCCDFVLCFLSTVSCQFPWIVHFLLFSRYSLTFIKQKKKKPTQISSPQTIESTNNHDYDICLHVHKTNIIYKLTAIVLDIAGHRLFKPVGIKKDEIDKRSFLKLSFANKGLDGINLGNILHHKSVKSKIPPYFKDQYVPIILHVYTRPIPSKNLITNMCCVISILTISNISLLIVPVQAPHSYMVRRVTL